QVVECFPTRRSSDLISLMGMPSARGRSYGLLPARMMPSLDARMERPAPYCCSDRSTMPRPRTVPRLALLGSGCRCGVSAKAVPREQEDETSPGQRAMHLVYHNRLDTKNAPTVVAGAVSC